MPADGLTPPAGIVLASAMVRAVLCGITPSSNLIYLLLGYVDLHRRQP